MITAAPPPVLPYLHSEPSLPLLLGTPLCSAHGVALSSIHLRLGILPNFGVHFFQLSSKICIPYEKKIEFIEGTIKTNLVSALSKEKGGLLLALQLSDIFSWDIDFTTDIRDDDVFRIVVEGLYIDGVFKKYGVIVSTEFVNDGNTFRAYRYEINSEADYYNE
jgi:hypothetical protein